MHSFGLHSIFSIVIHNINIGFGLLLYLCDCPEQYKERAYSKATRIGLCIGNVNTINGYQLNILKNMQIATSIIVDDFVSGKFRLFVPSVFKSM